jgi:hypothetical protein
MPPCEDLWEGYKGLRGNIARRLVEDTPCAFFDALRPAQSAWGWKDPRNCLTAPVFLPMFPRARAVFIYRQPWPVAASLVARRRLTAAKGPVRGGEESKDASLSYPRALSLWDVYNTSALKALDHFSRRAMLCYEELLARLVDEITRLLGELGIRPQAPIETLASLVRPVAQRATEAGVSSGTELLPEAALKTHARLYGATQRTIGHRTT